MEYEISLNKKQVQSLFLAFKKWKKAYDTLEADLEVNHNDDIFQLFPEIDELILDLLDVPTDTTHEVKNVSHPDWFCRDYPMQILDQLKDDCSLDDFLMALHTIDRWNKSS